MKFVPAALHWGGAALQMQPEYSVYKQTHTHIYRLFTSCTRSLISSHAWFSSAAVKSRREEPLQWAGNLQGKGTDNACFNRNTRPHYCTMTLALRSHLLFKTIKHLYLITADDTITSFHTAATDQVRVLLSPSPASRLQAAVFINYYYEKDVDLD